MTLETRNSIITVVLGIIIIGLGWYLYHSIVGPYQVVEKQKRYTREVRQNMENLRVALIHYNQEKKHFPPTKGGLDSLVHFIRTDSTMKAKRDSLFKNDISDGYKWKIDSLAYSPRPPHNKFKYTLNDSINPPLYLLKDPDSNDKIGSLNKPTLLNAPNWK